MTLAIIAAIGKNRVIGKAGKLPWHISDDLKRFKRLTMGNTVLMGRKTFESLGKPLPGRRNVVVTSRTIPGIETYKSLDAALAALADQERVFVIGGAQIYAQVLERADELYLTFVDGEYEGDVFFPPYEHFLGTTYELVHEEHHAGYTFADYRRKR
ncbi:MAG TPA: dihydrofolate reductase [Bacteroidota bacterium]|nr:dihydrofolate reductase [Bacteroidota bacterium]